MGKEVWLNSKSISTRRPSSKLDHRWLGPSSKFHQILMYAYILTLTVSMQGIHPVFHLYFLGKQKQDSIVEQQQLEPGYVEIYRKDKWNVKDLLIC